MTNLVGHSLGGCSYFAAKHPWNWTFSYLKGLLCSNLIEILHAIFPDFHGVQYRNAFVFFNCYISVWYFKGLSLFCRTFLGLRGCQLWPPPKESVSSNFSRSIKLNGSLLTQKSVLFFFQKFLCCRKKWFYPKNCSPRFGCFNLHPPTKTLLTCTV